MWLLASVLCLTACVTDGGDGGDDSISVQELEQVLEDARACTAGDECIAIDTYCCPRPINASEREVVEDAHGRLDPVGSECLADCVSISDLEANCVKGQCSLLPF